MNEVHFNLARAWLAWLAWLAWCLNARAEMKCCEVMSYNMMSMNFNVARSARVARAERAEM